MSPEPSHETPASSAASRARQGRASSSNSTNLNQEVEAPEGMEAESRLTVSLPGSRSLMSEERLTYRDAGVDIDAANEAVQRMRAHVRSTFTPGVLTDVGSFGGMFSLAGC